MVTFTADTNWYGQEEISFTIDDQNLRITDTDVVSVTIIPVNDPPVIDTLDNVTIVEDSIAVINLSASDIEIGEEFLSFDAFSDHPDFVIVDLTMSEELNAPVLTLTPAMDFFGDVQITVSVTDGEYTDTGIFTLIVLPVNDSPSLFALIDQDSIYITMENFDSDSIVFSWDESVDVDMDDLTYYFTANRLQGIPGPGESDQRQLSEGVR